MPRDWDAGAYDRLPIPMTRWGTVVVSWLDLEGDERVLDAGCGTGQVTERLLERRDRRVRGANDSPGQEDRMNLNTLLFGVYPYICLAVFLIGSWLRYDREPYTWRSESSQMLKRGNYFNIASNFFHLGILGIFFGHLVGLLTPVQVFHAIGLEAGAKQWLAIIAGMLNRLRL